MSLANANNSLLQGAYFYNTRTNYPYPPPTLEYPIGYSGNFGTGVYGLGGGYFKGRSYLARPLTQADILLARTGGNLEHLGYPHYPSWAVYGQVRPDYWQAQRDSFEAIPPSPVILPDNRPVFW